MAGTLIIAKPIGAIQRVHNFAFQVRSQGQGTAADALINLQDQIDQGTGFILDQVQATVATTDGIISFA